MKRPAYLLAALLMIAPGTDARVGFVADNYFPAESEFSELGPVAGEESFTDPERLSKVQDGLLFADAGFDKYARRIYKTGDSRSLSIEVVTLRDRRAAFSILTLLRDAILRDGPPGDEYSVGGDSLCFAQGRQWVRIRGIAAPQDLIRRIAVSMSNRIGSQREKPPSLISHFPKPGYDASTLRYFVGDASFRSYSSASPKGYVRFTSGMELAQARYSMQNQTGILSLSILPTAQVAEDYYSLLPSLETAHGGDIRTYAKRAGPLIAILEGSFDAGVADKILSPIHYSFSVRWIYEKPKPKTVWGVPMAILGTVVNSLLFVALLCGLSILAGLCVAVFRFWLRAYAPGNPLDRPERTEITRLKLP